MILHNTNLRVVAVSSTYITLTKKTRSNIQNKNKSNPPTEIYSIVVGSRVPLLLHTEYIAYKHFFFSCLFLFFFFVYILYQFIACMSTTTPPMTNPSTDLATIRQGLSYQIGVLPTPKKHWLQKFANRLWVVSCS